MAGGAGRGSGFSLLRCVATLKPSTQQAEPYPRRSGRQAPLRRNGLRPTMAGSKEEIAMATPSPRARTRWPCIRCSASCSACPTLRRPRSSTARSASTCARTTAASTCTRSAIRTAGASIYQRPGGKRLEYLALGAYAEDYEALARDSRRSACRRPSRIRWPTTRACGSPIPRHRRRDRPRRKCRRPRTVTAARRRARERKGSGARRAPRPADAAAAPVAHPACSRPT